MTVAVSQFGFRTFNTPPLLLAGKRDWIKDTRLSANN